MTSRGVFTVLIFVVLMVCCGCGTILGVSDQFEPRTLPDDVVMDDGPIQGYRLPSGEVGLINAAPILGNGIGSLPDPSPEPTFTPGPSVLTRGLDLGPGSGSAADPNGWVDGPGTMPPTLSAPVIVDDRTWQPVYFAYNQDFIGDAGQRQLEQLSDYLGRNGQFHLVLEGHCDERGSEGYNRSLGERRAIAVMNYLVALGVPDGRMKTISYGEERPAVNGAGESSWRQNRRAEIIVVNPR
ncbi:MAG: peptidoglycan-associated lipoprotein [Rhodothermales bacterium]|jgi:peptidoglycan-associated lipoprotein